MTERPVSTVIFADDHPLFRQGLLRTVEHDPSVSVVGEAGNGKDALKLILERKPDIAVLDISMPGMEGLDVVRAAVKDESCTTEFIILTMFKEEAYFTEAMDVGVKGYLLKDSAPADILACIKSVADGIPYVSPLVSHYLVRRTTKLVHRSPKPSIDDLTQQERRVLKLLSQNKTSREIADELSISVRTVQHHRNNICTKLNLEGYNKLLQFALENKNRLA
ncbi:MAG: response regulator transcription factor [Bacteroidetes bacterium]|nr:response regulator transcription factor [Bacteroidota bacterium]MCW5894148.1 response regulator transcription factor [Bacteroidota bacterium]